MAGGDVQVKIPNGPAPTAKIIDGVDSLIPKSVNATFDGTGAGSAFLPCLIITGKEGFEVARIPAPQVAAGASAEVSWFPRVAAPAAAVATTVRSFSLAFQGNLTAGDQVGSVTQVVPVQSIGLFGSFALLTAGFTWDLVAAGLLQAGCRSQDTVARSVKLAEGYVQKIGSTAHAVYTGLSHTLPAGGFAGVTWDSLVAGTPLLDTSTPAFPQVLADGVYALTVVVQIT